MTGIPVAPGELVDTGYLNEVARAHYRKTTAKQVVNSVVETDLLNGEITIGAGAMGTGRMLRVVALGDWINNTGAAVALPIFKVKLGATTLLANIATAAGWGASASRFGWKAVIEIQNLAANSQWANLALEGFQGGPAASAGNTLGTGEGFGLILLAGGAGLTKIQGGGSGAVDTTIAQTLAFTVTLATANALEDVTLKSAVVEVV